jgi:hypothetical protein
MGFDYNADRLEALAEPHQWNDSRRFVNTDRGLRREGAPMTDIVNSILERGDLAHLALFLWACAATMQAYLALRELGEGARRLDAFVRELARFNRRYGSDR